MEQQARDAGQKDKSQQQGVECNATATNTQDAPLRMRQGKLGVGSKCRLPFLNECACRRRSEWGPAGEAAAHALEALLPLTRQLQHFSVAAPVQTTGPSDHVARF